MNWNRMHRIGIGWVVVLIVGLATRSRGQDRVALMPVYSLEAFAVNSVPIPEGPKGTITVAPGDVITAKILIRNWSPSGQKLRSYQAQIDPAGYSSGTAGTVKPVGHNPGLPNESNAFVDLNDPDFVHKGLQSIPICDSASEGYRWLDVLLNGDEGPVSAQDGKKFACGTLMLQAAPDASGTFKIGFVEEPGTSGLLDPENQLILPIGYDSLAVEVRPGVHWVRIESSDPPNGAVDGRLTLSSAGRSDASWKRIKLVLSCEAGSLKADDFVVADGTASPPKIVSVDAQGNELVITLDRGIRENTWTTITYPPSGTFVRIGRLEGDVSNDGRADANDLMVLIRGLNGEESLPLYQGDLDRDGVQDARDVLRIIDLLTRQHPARTRLPR